MPNIKFRFMPNTFNAPNECASAVRAKAPSVRTAGSQGSAPLPKGKQRITGSQGSAPLPKDRPDSQGPAPLPKDQLAASSCSS